MPANNRKPWGGAWHAPCASDRAYLFGRDAVLKYIKRFPEFWFVRHKELAQWVKDNEIDEWTNQKRFYG